MKKRNIKVEQLENKNQFVLSTEKGKYFQSYNSLVAFYDYDKRTLTLGQHWDYSQTTRKHLYIFINEYCYLEEVERELRNSKNKRQTIIKLLRDKVVKFDKNMF